MLLIANEDKSKTCGMVFCRIKDVSTAMAPPIAPLHHEQRVKSYVQSKAQDGSASQVQPQQSSLGKRKRKDGLEDDILNFRRVQIKSAGMSRTRCKLYELRDMDWFDHGTGSCHYRYINVRVSTSRTCNLKDYVNPLLTGYRAYLG
jgi:hypothetical protein